MEKLKKQKQKQIEPKKEPIQKEPLKKAKEELNFDKELQILEEPLRTIKVGWFSRLSNEQIEALKFILKNLKKEDVNLNCYNCVREGLIYVKERLQ